MAETHKHLFISPHPDDIAFSAFASLTRLAKDVPRGMVTVFSQSCWTFNSEIDPKNAREVSNRRREEDRRFARAHGLSLIRLGFRDTSLRGMRAGEEYRRLPLEDPVYRAVLTALARFLEGEGRRAVSYVPLGISHHLDHLIVRDAVLTLRSSPRGVVFYEDLPYCDNYSEEEIREFARAVSPATPLVPRLTDFTERWSEKVAAVRLYESQLEAGTIESLKRYAARVGGGGRLAERVWEAGPYEPDGISL